MWCVDRSVLVVRPRQPFLDWVRSLEEPDSDFTLDELRNDCTAFLVPAIEDESQQTQIVMDLYEEIFENELWAWIRDPAVWPQQRDYATFAAWFELEFCSLAMDVVGGPFVAEEA